MAGPWEAYQNPAAPEAGPWTVYANPPPPGVIIHDRDRSYVTPDPNAPAGTPNPPSVDTRGMAPGMGIALPGGPAPAGLAADIAAFQKAMAEAPKLPGQAPAQAGPVNPNLSNRNQAAAALAARRDNPIADRTLLPLLQGGTMGYGDEFASLGAASLAALRGRPFGETYDLAQEAQRQDLAQVRQEYPKSSTALQIGGALATAPALGALGLGRMAVGGAPRVAGGVATQGVPLGARMLGGAGVGAGLGLLSGFGEGSGFEDRALHGALGAGTGAVIGGAVPPVAEGVSTLYNRILDNSTVNRSLQSIGLGRPAGDLAMRMLHADDALAPGGIGRQNIANAGPGAMLADAGPNATATLDTAIQRGGGGSMPARQAIDARASEANTNLTDALDRTLGPPRGIQTMTDEISDAGSAVRRSLYDVAYGAPIDYSGQAGQRLENIVNSRVPSNVIAEANAKMRIRGEPLSSQIKATIDANGNAVLERLPDVRQLDYITRALYDVAESPGVAGALGKSTGKSKDYERLAAQIRGETRGLVPEYGAALDKAGDDIGRVKATQLGYDLLSPKMTRDDVAHGLLRHQASAAEMDQTLAGARSYIDDTMARVRAIATDPNQDAREAARILKDLQSRETSDKLNMVITDPAQRADLQQQIDYAARAIQLRANLTANSKTFAREANAQAGKQMLAGGPVDATLRGEPLNIVKRTWQELTGRNAQYDLSREDAMQRQVAELLTRARGPEAERQLGLLADAYRTVPANAARAQAAGGQAGLLAGVPAHQAIRQFLLGY